MAVVERLATFGGHRALVLLAEDDDELRSLLATVLRKDGHEVAEARTGVELLRALEAGAGGGCLPDVVVSDVQMPGLTGLEVASALRLAASRVPIVLITAFGDDDAHGRARELGAIMLDKPFDLGALRATVRAVLSGGEQATGTG